MYNTPPKGTLKAFNTILLLLAIIVAVSLFGCKSETGKTPTTKTKKAPQGFVGGKRLFDENCARCHGKEGIGTDKGPPLVHKIYEPNHHADMSFHLAAKRGVRAHHWGFGNMPRVNGVDEGEVAEIIAYVRRLQRQAGIY